MSVRRVVTGLGPGGKSVVVSDGSLAPVTVRALPGYAWHKLWGVDGPAAVPNDGAPGPAGDPFPPPAGVRFNVFTVPPAGQRVDPDLDPRAARHAWRKRGTEPCTLVICLLGAELR